MKNSKYYKQQLKKSKGKFNGIKIYSEMGESNCLDLNNESIPIIIKHLNKLLIKTKKRS